MKKLIINSITFFMILFAVFEIYGTIILRSENPFSNRIRWFSGYKTTLRSYIDLKSDTVFLGGSVGHQLFFPGKTPNSLASNGAAFCAGNHIMMCNLIEHNPSLKCIVFVSHPIMFKSAFEGRNTYSGFVRKFYNYRNLKYFDAFLLGKIAQKPLGLLNVFNTFKILPFSDINYGTARNRDDKTSKNFNLVYLEKMINTAKENDIEFFLVSPPISDTHWAKISKKLLEDEIEALGLGVVVDDYFDNIVVLPDDLFKDKVHFKFPYLKENKQKLRKMMKQLK